MFGLAEDSQILLPASAFNLLLYHNIILPLENSPIYSKEYVREKGKFYLSIIINSFDVQTPRPYSENQCSNKCPSMCNYVKVHVLQTGDRKCLWRLEGRWASTRASLFESLSLKQLNLSSYVPSISWCACGYMLSHSVMSDSLRPCGLQPTRLLCPWASPGKNIGVGYHALLQGIFPTHGSNLNFLCHLYWQVCSLPLAPPGKSISWYNQVTVSLHVSNLLKA